MAVRRVRSRTSRLKRAPKPKRNLVDSDALKPQPRAPKQNRHGKPEYPAPRKLLGKMSHREYAATLEELQEILADTGFDDERMHVLISDAFDRTKASVEESRALSDAAVKARLGSVERRSALDHYVLYLLQQSRLVRDLEDVKQSARDSVDSKNGGKKDGKDGAALGGLAKHAVAFTNAVKMQSELYDKVLRAGRDFGLIPRVGRKQTFDGQSLMQLGSVEVAVALKAEVTMMQTLINAAADGIDHDTEDAKGRARDRETTKVIDAKVNTDILSRADNALSDTDPEQAVVALQQGPLPDSNEWRRDVQKRDPSRRHYSAEQRMAAIRRLYVEGTVHTDPLRGPTRTWPSLATLAQQFHYAMTSLQGPCNHEKWLEQREAFREQLQEHSAVADTTRGGTAPADGDSGETRVRAVAGLPESHIREKATSLSAVQPSMPVPDVEPLDAVARAVLRALQAPAGGSPRLHARSMNDLIEMTGYKYDRVRNRVHAVVGMGLAVKVHNKRWTASEAGIARIADVAQADSVDEAPRVHRAPAVASPGTVSSHVDAM